MTVFLTVSPRDEDLTEILEGTLKEEERFKISSDKWLIASGRFSTSSGAYAVVGEKRTSMIITPLTSYYGRADAAIWQWIESRRKSV